MPNKKKPSRGKKGKGYVTPSPRPRRCPLTPVARGAKQPPAASLLAFGPEQPGNETQYVSARDDPLYRYLGQIHQADGTPYAVHQVPGEGSGQAEQQPPQQQ